MALTPGDDPSACRATWHGRIKTTSSVPSDPIYVVSHPTLYIRCPRRRVLGCDRDGSIERKPGNGHRGDGTGWRSDTDVRFHSARRQGSREGCRAVSAPVIRRRAAARGPDRPGCRVCRAPRQSGSAGDSVAVGPCMVRQAVVVCFPEDATCGGAGRAATRSPANRGTGRPRRDGWRYVSVVLLGGRFVDAAGIFDHRITNRRCGHRADRVLHLLKDG